MSPRSLVLLFLGAALAGSSGCRRAEVSTYRVPREKPAPSPAIAPAATGVAAGTPTWTVPAGWSEQPAAQMRIATFAISADDGRKADMSVTAFPGSVGGDLANVNRWRAQIGLAPIDEAKLNADMGHADLGAGHFDLIDLVSEKPMIEDKFKARILGAWLKQPDRTWFFKLMGEDALVQAQRANFEAFIASVHFGATPPAGMPAGAAPSAPMPTSMPPMPPVAGTMPGAATAPSASALAWTAPSTWSAKPPTQMRKGSYAIRDAATNTEADLSIISFPGAAGGLLDNVNRWRGQIGLPPLSPMELPAQTSSIEVGALRFTVVDFAGNAAAGPTRIVGAVASAGGETYFFKLMGPDALVAREKAAFLAFIQTVHAR